jgi:hypothetical protein
MTTTLLQPTDEQIDALWREACKRQTLTRELVRDFARAVLAAQPAPVEPEYWQWRRKAEQWDIEQIYRHEVHATTDDSEVRKLYTHPAAPAPDLIPQDALFVCGQMGANVTRVRVESAAPVPVPLTDVQIDMIWNKMHLSATSHRKLARAIERAHGITGASK